MDTNGTPALKRQHDVHVMPRFGRPHLPNCHCWCHPEKDEKLLKERPMGPFLWLHRTPN